MVKGGGVYPSFDYDSVLWVFVLTQIYFYLKGVFRLLLFTFDVGILTVVLTPIYS